MSKTKEELNKIKEDVEAVNEKLAELTPEEIAQVNGGVARHTLVEEDPVQEDPVQEFQKRCPYCGKCYTGAHHCVIT